MATPYLSVSMLNAASTGIPWNQIPDIDADDLAKAAEQTNILWRATSLVDTFCRQPLRSVVSSEPLSGPGMPRFGWQAGGEVPQFVMRRWPVTEVLAIQLSPSRLPRVWSTVPAEKYEIEFPVIDLYSYPGSPTAPDGGSSIICDPGVINKATTRRGSLRALISYTNGWPHTSLTAAAEAGSSTLQVDDVTGWGAVAGFAYDGASTEPLTVLSAAATTPLELPNAVGTAQTGPGTLTLAAPLDEDHAPGVVVSALPASTQLGTAYACILQALDAGIEAITAEVLPGSTTSGGNGIAWVAKQFKDIFSDFRRVV